MATGAIENEALLGWINPINKFLDGIQESTSNLSLAFAPEFSSALTGWDVLNYSQQAHLYQEMRIGEDFVGCVTNMAKIPTNYYELLLRTRSPSRTVRRHCKKSLQAAFNNPQSCWKGH